MRKSTRNMERYYKHDHTLFLPMIQNRKPVNPHQEKLGMGIPWQHCQIEPTCYQHILSQFENASWFYNWRYDLCHLDLSIPYVPMLYEVSHRERNRGYFEDSIRTALEFREQCPIWLLGNEPDRADQSSTTPRDFYLAYQDWGRRAHVDKILAPGIYWDENGREWLGRFLQHGTGISALSVHLYPHTAAEWRIQLEDIFGFLDLSRLTRNLPVVVTETNVFSFDRTEQLRLMDIIDGAIDSEKRLQGVCWYAWKHHDLSSPWRGYELSDDHEGKNDLGDRYSRIRESI